MGEARRKRLIHDLNIGATGEYPAGKMSPYDEGAIRLAVADDGRGNVRIEFGKPVAWLAMPKEQAVEFALVILRNAGHEVIVQA